MECGSGAEYLEAIVGGRGQSGGGDAVKAMPIATLKMRALRRHTADDVGERRAQARRSHSEVRPRTMARRMRPPRHRAERAQRRKCAASVSLAPIVDKAGIGAIAGEALRQNRRSEPVQGQSVQPQKPEISRSAVGSGHRRAGGLAWPSSRRREFRHAAGPRAGG